MPKKLQEKEFFIPLTTGAQTGGTPVLPLSTTSTTENAMFDVNGVVKKRPPLAVLSGDAVSDTETSVTSGRTALYADPGGVFLFGNGTAELSSIGTFTQTSYNSFLTASVLMKPVLLHEIRNEDSVYAAKMIISNEVSTLGEYMVYTETDNNCFVYAANSGYYYNALTSCEDLFTWTSNSVVCVNAGSGSIRYDTFTNTVGFSTVQTGSSGFLLSATSRYDTLYFEDHGALVIWEGWGTTSYGLHAADDGADVLTSVNTATAGSAQIQRTHLSAIDANFAIGSLLTSTANAFVSLIEVNSTGAYERDNSTVSSISTNTEFCISTMSYNSDTAVMAVSSNDSSENHVIRFYHVDYNTVAGTITANTSVQSTVIGQTPVSEIFKGPDGNMYILTVRRSSNEWGTSPPESTLGSQNYLILLRYSPEDREVYQVSRSYIHADALLYNGLYVSRFRSYVDSSGITRYYIGLILPRANKQYSGGFQYYAAYMDLNFSTRDLDPKRLGRYIISPGGSPSIYDGATSYQLGGPDYPDLCYVDKSGTGGGSFQDTGVHTYCITHSYIDRFGIEHESAPSYYDNASVTSTSDNVYVYSEGMASAFYQAVSNPKVGNSVYPLSRNRFNIYRSTADGADLYQVHTGSINTNAQFTETNTLDDYASAPKVTSGFSTLFRLKALYTLNGTLENIPAFGHRVSTVHQGRYCYAPYELEDSVVYYSKVYSESTGIGFNEILRINCSVKGGRITALESVQDVLMIFKESAIYVVYGEGLNDAGAGQGYSEPRLITAEHGAVRQKAVERVGESVYFVSSVDGLIYRTSSSGVEYIGDPVRHYCGQYDYSTVWSNPRESTVKFGSQTSGAPCLSYNYKYNKWTTLTGRYAQGIISATAATVGGVYGQGNAHVDVIIDSNSNAYIQDITSTYGTTESYDLKVSTSWIPLNDIAGYGKFYKWTLVGGKTDTNCNIIARTAYAYEPYWSDNTEVSITTNVGTFGTNEHFGDMTNSTWVDKSLKYEFDGSRHKTDSVRIQIETNNGTERDNIELVGIRCRVGVKPGAYRLGDSRSTN